MSSFSALAILAIEPVYHWFALTIFMVVLMAFHRDGALKVAIVLAAYIGVIVFTPFPSWLMSQLESQHAPVESPENVEAVVVLSGGIVKYDSSRNQYHWGLSGSRYLEAHRAFSKSKAVFVLTGVAKNHDQSAILKSEALSMQLYSQEMSIESGRLFVDEDSKTTWENAENAARFLQQQGIENFYLVTSSYHMPRSMMVFRHFQVEPKPFPVDFKVTGSVFRIGYSNIAIYRLAIHEILGLVYYKAAMFWQDAPTEVASSN